MLNVLNVSDVTKASKESKASKASKEFIAVAGATASGKSALALELARRLDGEIVSCDSMQIYRTMDVGTAKPSAEEMKTVPHHMIDIADPGDSFSAGDYCRMAGKIIDDIISRRKVPIVCGGTFLYLDSLVLSYTRSEAPRDDGLRRSLEEYAEKNGNAALHEKLREIDSEAANAIHENNVKRVIRAIEIYKTSGRTKSEWDALSREAAPPYKPHMIIIDYKDRTVLYDRINRRVDAMLEAGLEDEARRLYEGGYLKGEACAAQAIGYKEFIDCFENRISLAEVADQIKQASRNLAKRQLTWMKRYKEALRLYPDAKEPMSDSAALADAAIEALREMGALNSFEYIKKGD